jgi:hypothetical protein
MATKKGSKITKASETTLILETKDPIAGVWITFSVADNQDEEQVEHIMKLSEQCEKAKMAYRLIDRSVKTRTQITETVVQGEGKEATPVAGMT